MRDARTSRRASVAHSLNVMGLFGLFRREKEASAPPVVKVDMPATGPLPPPPPAAEQPASGLRRDLRFQGLHADVNPSQSVRPAEMTCPNCERHFRYFTNSNGMATTVRCPGCARQYRV